MVSLTSPYGWDRPVLNCSATIRCLLKLVKSTIWARF